MMKLTDSGSEVSTLIQRNRFPPRHFLAGFGNPKNLTRSAGLFYSPRHRLTSRPFESLIYKIVELSAPALLALASSPEESLTLLLLLDQFSRNIMRGKAVHWVYTTADPTALHVAHHCLRQGYDSALPPHKKFWFYLVLSHSESMLDQEMALAKAANLACDVHFGPWKAWHPAFKDILGHTIKYYTTIDKFGRFPHRNAFLERETTDEEQQFLKEGNP